MSQPLPLDSQKNTAPTFYPLTQKTPQEDVVFADIQKKLIGRRKRPFTAKNGSWPKPNVHADTNAAKKHIGARGGCDGLSAI